MARKPTARRPSRHRRPSVAMAINAVFPRSIDDHDAIRVRIAEMRKALDEIEGDNEEAEAEARRREIETAPPESGRYQGGPL